MVRAFRLAVFRDVAGACRPPAERRGGGRAAQSPESARHERLRLRLANGIRPTLEDGALCARRRGCLSPKCRVVNRAMLPSWHGATVSSAIWVWRTMRSAWEGGEWVGNSTTPTNQPFAVLPACVRNPLTRTRAADDAHSDHNQPVRFP